MDTQTAFTPTLGAIDVIHRRRAVRHYREDVLDEATINQLLDAAVQAPTAMHREPWAFVVIQDPALLRRISDMAKSAVVAEATAHGDLLRAPGATPNGRHHSMLEAAEFNVFYDANTLILIGTTGHGAFDAADCWLAAENLMLAACALGLGSCPIGLALPAVHDPALRRELGLPDDFTPIAAVITGVPAGETPPVPRKPPHVLRWVRPPRR